MRINYFLFITVNFLINGFICSKRSEDAELSVPELIEKYGYPCEKHHVTTEDGYILELHRIPTPNRSKHPPIIIKHGLGGTSDAWILLGPGKALGYLLSDLGYDIWLGNGRGNTYSRNHTTLRPHSNRRIFWNYSVHEMGIYDLPACIDYILQETKQTQIYYIAHSQGCAELFVLLDHQPSYNGKIKAFFALAPAIYVGHVKSPVLAVQALANTIGEVKLFQFPSLFEFMGSFELLKKTNGVFDGIKGLCSSKERAGIDCRIFLLLLGEHSDQMDASFVPVILGHMPVGVSSKQFNHYMQMIVSDRFRRYDYGKGRNNLIYEQRDPPKYNLRLATVPTYVYYGRTDGLVVPKDVQRLIQQIRNLKQAVMIGNPNFSHLDFTYGSEAKKDLYDLIIRDLKTLESISFA